MQGGIILIALFHFAIANATDFNSTYEASSGVFPDEVCPPWTPIVAQSPADPLLSGGKLLISTLVDGENVAYIQSAPDIVVPDPLVIETRVKFVSGSASIPARAPIMILFTTSPNVGNALLIGADEIFINADNLVKGDSAIVDTNDAFHTYRIEVSGTGSIEVFYDDVLMLTGSTFTSVDFNGGVERVEWGEISLFAFGTSEWELVRHNASTVTCGVGGSVTGITPRKVLCINHTTGQNIQVQTSETSWNCEELGLVVNPGDRVFTGMKGFAE